VKIILQIILTLNVYFVTLNVNPAMGLNKIIVLLAHLQNIYLKIIALHIVLQTPSPMIMTKNALSVTSHVLLASKFYNLVFSTINP